MFVLAERRVKIHDVQAQTVNKLFWNTLII